MNVQLETSKLNEATNFQMIEALPSNHFLLYMIIYGSAMEAEKKTARIEKSNLFNNTKF